MERKPNSVGVRFDFECDFIGQRFSDQLFYFNSTDKCLLLKRVCDYYVECFGGHGCQNIVSGSYVIHNECLLEINKTFEENMIVTGDRILYLFSLAGHPPINVAIYEEKTLVQKKPRNVPKVHIIIRVHPFDTLPIDIYEISLLDTIGQLKCDVCLRKNIPYSHQVLVFNKQRLDDANKTLTDYKVVDGSTIFLVNTRMIKP